MISSKKSGEEERREEGGGERGGRKPLRRSKSKSRTRQAASLSHKVVITSRNSGINLSLFYFEFYDE